jgi:hypothetical protein
MALVMPPDSSARRIIARTSSRKKTQADKVERVAGVSHEAAVALGPQSPVAAAYGSPARDRNEPRDPVRGTS